MLLQSPDVFRCVLTVQDDPCDLFSICFRIREAGNQYVVAFQELKQVMLAGIKNRVAGNTAEHSV